MPVNMSQWATIFSAKGYLYLHAPATMLSATCTTVNPIYPVSVVEYTSATGDYTDIRPGHTVMFGTAPGLDNLGRQRVRAAANSTQIPIGRSSRGRLRGEVDLSSGSTVYITVLDLHEVWARIPNIVDAVLFKDEQPYSDTLAIAPLANAGPHVANFVDPNTGTLTLDFSGLNSFSLDGTLSYSWDFGDATPSSSTSATPTGISFPPGARYIYLTVTANGRSHTTAVLVAALERTGANAPIPVEVGTRVLRPEGQTGSFTIKGADIPISTYPRGTQGIYFEVERYGGIAGTNGSLVGPTGREHVKFNFWIETEPTEINAAREGIIRQVTLQCTDVAERLRKIPQFPQVLHRKASATTWAHIKSSIAHLNGAILYYLRHHTTALEVADFTRAAIGDSYTFSLLAGEQGSPYAQADRLARAMRHRLTCNERGQLAVVPYPQYFPTASQASTYGLTARTTTVAAALTESHWTSLRYTDSQPPGIHWNNGSAIVVSTQDGEASGRTDTPLFTIAPGTAPGQGIGAIESGEQLILSQDELNVIEGNRYAANNAVQSLFELSLVHGGDAGIEPAAMEWVTLNVSAAYAAQRGLTFTAERFLPVQVEFELGANGVKRQKLTLERETSGQPATTVVRSVSSAPPYEPPELPPIEYETPTDPPVSYFPSGGNRLALIMSNRTVKRTTNFNNPSLAGGPTWSSVAIPGITGDVVQWCVDASAPENGWVVTTHEVGYLQNLFGSVSYTVQHTFATSTYERGIDFSFGAGGAGKLGVIVSYYGASGGTKALYTGDGGLTWNGEVTVDSDYDTNSGGGLNYPGVFVSSKVAGLVYTSAFINTGPFAYSNLFKSTTGGASWTDLGNAENSVYMSNDIHAPWHDNPSDVLVYYGINNQDGPLDAALASYNGSTHTTDLGPNDGSRNHGGAIQLIPRGLIKTLTTNRRIMLMSCGAWNGSNFEYTGIWRTTDLNVRANWYQVTTQADGYTHAAFVESDPTGRSFYVYGGANIVGYCTDGINVDPRIGDLVVSSERPVGIAG